MRILIRFIPIIPPQILPIAEFIGAVTPAYLRLRVTTGIDLFLITVVNGAIMWVLSPRNAAEAFKVYDGSSPAGFLSDLADPLHTGIGGADDFHAALDQAYAYTDLKEGLVEGEMGSAASASSDGMYGGGANPNPVV